MSCEEYADAIVNYACGAEIEAAAAAHLARCRECRQLLDEQRRFVDGVDAELQEALAIEPSPRFAADVMARVERSSPGRRRWIWWTMPAAAAAVLALVVFASTRSTDPPALEGASVAAVPATSPPPAVGPVSQPGHTPGRAGGRSSAKVRRPAVEHTPRVVSARGAALPPAAEALVPTDRAIAVAHYLALVRSGSLDAPRVMANEPSGNSEPVEPVELVVAPLSVDAVVLPDVERGSVVAAEQRGLK
jgi:hypothetical protein